MHVGVEDLQKSVQFYSSLFGEPPTKLKDDYAKWMLEDPRVNFAISTRVNTLGVDHLGIQVDEDAELEQITQRLKNADLGVYGEGDAVCCYASSKKAWVKDPSGLAWETYRNMGDADVFNAKPETPKASNNSCCPAPTSKPTANCCG